MADITGQVHHINLSVSDLDRSLSWYQSVFGLTEVARMTDGDGRWSRVILRHAGGLFVGLTQHSANGATSFDERRCGLDHVALAVDGLDELRAWESRLRDLDVEASAIKTTPLGSLITLRDPDNIQIELYSGHR